MLGCGFILFYSMGLAVNMFSIFLSPLIESLGVNKAMGSSVITAQYAVGLAGMLVGGTFYNRYSVRKVAFVYGLLIAAGYLVFAFSKSVWMCYAATVLTGVGYGGGSVIPTSILINRWFTEKRGIALALSACGSGIATILYPPVIERMIEHNGLTAAFLFQGISIAVFAVISYLLLRDFPEEKGLLPYGGPREVCDPEDTQAVAGVSATTLKTLLTEKKFIALMAAAMVTGMAILPSISHLAVFYTSSGYSTLFASVMLSTYGVIMLFGKPLYGAINDRFGTKKGNLYIFSVWILAMISGLLLHHGLIFAYLFVIFLGLGAALSMVTTPIWTTDLFGSQNYGQIYTYLRFFLTFGGTVSMILPGLSADLFGSYQPVLMLYLILTVITYIIIRMLYNKYSRQ